MSNASEERREPRSRVPLARIGLDWWATLVAAVIATLAVADVLPRIPW